MSPLIKYLHEQGQAFIGLRRLSDGEYCLPRSERYDPCYQGRQASPLDPRVTQSRIDSTHRNGHKVSPYAVDSLARKQHDPRKATIRSAIFPGLGQIYNRKYWKLPIVWAAVGIPAYTYFYNRGWYQRCQFALSIIDNYQAAGITQIPDSIIAKVNGQLQPFVASLATIIHYAPPGTSTGKTRTIPSSSFSCFGD